MDEFKQAILARLCAAEESDEAQDHSASADQLREAVKLMEIEIHRQQCRGELLSVYCA